MFFLDNGTSTEDQSDSDKCDEDDSSDEELFNPVAFLCDNRIKPNIRTPEKAMTPVTGSPLTPISPFVTRGKDVRVLPKYSLDKLLLEKPKQVEKDKALARLQLAMHQAIVIGMCLFACIYNREVKQATFLTTPQIKYIPDV